MRRYPKLLLLILGLGALAVTDSADAARRGRVRSTKSITARKGAVQSGFTDRIDPGHFQLETNLADWQSGESPTTIIGDSVLRIGASRNTEFQIGWTPLFVNNGQKGSGDLRLGFRQVLRDARLGVVVQPVVTLPTGSKSFSANRMTAGVTLGVTYDISHSTQLYATPTVLFAPNAIMSTTIGLNEHIAGPVDMAFEAFAQRANGDPTQTQYSVGNITTYKFSEKFELNAGVAVGLNRNTPPVELVLGFTRAF